MHLATITPEVRAVQQHVIGLLADAATDLDQAAEALRGVATRIGGSSRGLRALQETVAAHQRTLAGIQLRLDDARRVTHVG